MELPELPKHAVVLVEERPSRDPPGFLRLKRMMVRVVFADGTRSEPFEYDAIDRFRLDAVVVAAHYRGPDGRRQVILRSALRPPVALRPREHSPVEEKASLGALWELPAGLVEEDERTLEGLRRCAARELHEEVGVAVSPDDLKPLGPSSFPAPGVIAERHFFFHVEIDPAKIHVPTEDGSALEKQALVVAVDLAHALALARTGGIEDEKTELGLRRLAEIAWRMARTAHVALVVKRSAWRIYVEERHDERLTEMVAAGDEAVAPLRASHEAHARTVREVKEALASLGAHLATERLAGEAFDCSGLDLVVTVGGDGALLAGSHFVADVPILAINSDPAHSVGFFCGARSGEAKEALRDALKGTLRRTTLARMAVTINGEVVAARVLNDALLCHASPAATSRYIVRIGDVEEQQKSSGFWIGPAAGSTAAQRSAGGRVLPLTSRQLQLVVREPYTPHGESYRLRHAFIPPGSRLSVRSKMHDARIFFDGPDKSTDIGYGDLIEFCQAEQSLTVLGISSRRKWG